MGTLKIAGKDKTRHSSAFTSYYLPVAAATANLPFIISEEMVNHKKMVHPPCM